MELTPLETLALVTWYEGRLRGAMETLAPTPEARARVASLQARCAAWQQRLAAVENLPDAGAVLTPTPGLVIPR